ncbi:hypothetical protein SELMODRAFT_443962 [Selaginella moellendorffii]|uniref:HECT-type E3 ubiquitin transferase n=1 Tax=Selaginella moellendorffii TaxID=88036 RepID=D8S5V8_SELML|nr:E3 ubiquitin-protein ligase UPL6 [Selaginella moellendorffii]EFJ20124.1 hypothetical protein SELMODRAFT_443962 [Selaginella moellendorffii]|eukprot:XP_002978677.1 E3 ubiquitin-protein ligase UPL6 [Selaginella moellendorffii]
MFFSGDPGLRRKVELRGRSSKESDRQGTLNRVKDEREQRQRARLRQQGALRIQKCFRGRRDVAVNQVLIREKFVAAFGEFSDRADRNVFKPESLYLPQIFFMISPKNSADFYRLAGACRHFLRCMSETEGGVFSVFVSGDYTTQRGAINYRVKHFAILCLQGLYHHRESLKEELMLPEDGSRDDVAGVLVRTILSLATVELPWSGSLIEHLALNKMFCLLRDLVLTLKNTDARPLVMLSLERLVHQLSVLYVEKFQYLKPVPFTWSLPAQIFSVPLLWRRLPRLKEVSVTDGVWAFVVHQTAINKLDLRSSLPSDVSPEFPSFVCLLGNLLESSRLAMQQPNTMIQLVTDIANVARTLLSTPPITCALCPKETFSDASEDDDMKIDIEESFALEPALISQLKHASDGMFLKEMVRVAFSQAPLDLNTVATPFGGAPEASAVSAVCGFLYAAFSVLDRTTIVSRLAYVANLVPPLWQYITSCRLNNNWPAIELPSQDAQLSPELLGWMLPLAVFCPVFSHLLFSMDNDEFYNMKQPISIEDVKQLVLILKEGLWQLLWVMPFKPSAFVASDIFVFQNMRQFFINVSASLLAELHDRNSKRQFAPSHTFHAREAIEESFFHQAEGENTKAREVLNRAPFLIPFTLRVRVYTAQRTAARQNTSRQYGLQIKVQRDRIIEDAFMQFNVLSDESLRGTIRVSYVNELGAEEAGVDGGGIFKDFMENITSAGFDIQYGLFKETADHLLYPNPASHMVNDEHLQYFEFFGKILGKAMFEGILVDIPFAMFFLRKLRKKHNYLHDLPSLDPELYKNLLFLKNNPNMVQQLGLYFVIEDNEYGEQLEVELLPGGKDIQVTKDNVYRYIHLVANHRLNHQIRQQSNHFLRGFQQLISPEWLDMFNEHELQILISGFEDAMDIDDLHHNVNYGGGYHENHPVIQMFWDTVKALDANMQRKFLKFVTGCSRGPLLGFKYLEPRFCIQKTAPEGAAEEALDRLPTSATCLNLLKLPPYKSKDTIREKLLYAIAAEAGFDLS